MHIYIEKSCGIIIENQTIKRGFGFLGNLRTASRRGFRAVAGRTLHQSSGASVGNPGAKSVKKKFKDKRFAAGCDREVIRKGCRTAGLGTDRSFPDRAGSDAIPAGPGRTGCPERNQRIINYGTKKLGKPDACRVFILHSICSACRT